jgi:hypothetical protein
MEYTRASHTVLSHVCEAIQRLIEIAVRGVEILLP